MVDRSAGGQSMGDESRTDGVIPTAHRNQTLTTDLTDGHGYEDCDPCISVFRAKRQSDNPWRKFRWSLAVFSGCRFGLKAATDRRRSIWWPSDGLV